MEIEYIKEHNNAYDIAIHNDTGSACFDLLADKGVVIKAKSKGIMTCGIRILIPEGYYAEIRNKSRIGFKNDIYIYNGIMDAGYPGDWSVKAFNYGEKDFVVKKGDSIAQVLILKKPNIVVKETNKAAFDLYTALSERKDKACREVSKLKSNNNHTVNKEYSFEITLKGVKNYKSIIFPKIFNRKKVKLKVTYEISALIPVYCKKEDIVARLKNKYYDNTVKSYFLTPADCLKIALFLIKEYSFKEVEVTNFDDEKGIAKFVF